MKYNQEAIDNRCRKVRGMLPKEGPWAEEGDREEFEYSGFPCILQRGPMGVWCGYVGVPEDHPDFKKHYNSIEEEIDVHGGLTYASECNGHICHKTDKDEERWWLGFDCGHAYDLTPLIPVDLRLGRAYKTITYAKEETKKLADQLRRRA